MFVFRSGSPSICHLFNDSVRLCPFQPKLLQADSPRPPLHPRRSLSPPCFLSTLPPDKGTRSDAQRAHDGRVALSASKSLLILSYFISVHGWARERSIMPACKTRHSRSALSPSLRCSSCLQTPKFVPFNLVVCALQAENQKYRQTSRYVRRVGQNVPFQMLPPTAYSIVRKLVILANSVRRNPFSIDVSMCACLLSLEDTLSGRNCNWKRLTWGELHPYVGP
jgi:hypothetical protein